jgi:hypothetical protein
MTGSLNATHPQATSTTALTTHSGPASLHLMNSLVPNLDIGLEKEKLVIKLLTARHGD